MCSYAFENWGYTDLWACLEVGVRSWKVSARFWLRSGAALFSTSLNPGHTPTMMSCRSETWGGGGGGESELAAEAPRQRQCRLHGTCSAPCQLPGIQGMSCGQCRTRHTQHSPRNPMMAIDGIEVWEQSRKTRRLSRPALPPHTVSPASTACPSHLKGLRASGVELAAFVVVTPYLEVSNRRLDAQLRTFGRPGMTKHAYVFAEALRHRSSVGLSLNPKPQTLNPKRP